MYRPRQPLGYVYIIPSSGIAVTPSRKFVISPRGKSKIDILTERIVFDKWQERENVQDVATGQDITKSLEEVQKVSDEIER